VKFDLAYPLICVVAMSICGCKHISVVYPVCLYTSPSESDWLDFVSVAQPAISNFFGGGAQFSLSGSKRTLSVRGYSSQHKRFIPWLAAEACIPNYRNSGDRGAFVVCSSFIERAANNALEYSLKTQTGRPKGIDAPNYSDIFRDMDAQDLNCQRAW
jgi:hypothetical protein